MRMSLKSGPQLNLIFEDFKDLKVDIIIFSTLIFFKISNDISQIIDTYYLTIVYFHRIVVFKCPWFSSNSLGIRTTEYLLLCKCFVDDF